jgi:hypothetical protein
VDTLHLTLAVALLRFEFLAREPIHFPEGKASNILRGAFGTVFRRLACEPRASRSYSRFFELSGSAHHPRPFVLRAAHLNGRTLSPGESFHFDVNLFDLPASEYVILAFTELAKEGLGPGRRKVQFVSVESSRLTLDLRPNDEAVSRVTVRFLTPTELKHEQKVAPRPEFSTLAARIRDRISALSELYGSGSLEMDSRGFNERASRVRMTRCDITDVQVRRKSSRTGQEHSIGGFIGEAEYEGELSEFVPNLKAAKWTGVGRQTVWGKGELDLVVMHEARLCTPPLYD